MAEGGALRELLAQFGIEVDTKQLDAASNKLSGFIGNVKKVAGVVASAFAVEQVYAFAEGIAHQIHQVEATAAALGITTQATQEYGYASRAAGMDAGELLNMMGRLQVTAANADKGESGKAFSAIGVSAKDASGKIKSADVLLEDVAEGIKRTEDPAKRAAAAVGLFGRQGRVLLPFLVRGKDGIQQLRKEFADLGGGFDKEAIEKSAAFEHSMAKVGVVVDGIRSVVVHGLFPALSWVADKAAAIGGWFVRMAKNTDIVRNALILLGALLAPLAIDMALAFAPLLVAAASAAAVLLVFDDIVTMFEGGKSVIGDQIDKIFGKGQSAKLVQAVKDAWVEMKDAFRDMWPYVKQVYEAMKWIVEKGISTVGRVGGYVGDKLGIAANAVKEEAGVRAGGKGGQDNTQNLIGLNAKAYLEAKQRGEDVSSFKVPNIPKGMTPDSALQATMAILPAVNRGDTGFTQFQSRYAPSAPASSGGDTINVNVAGSTGMKEHELKRAVADGVREARQQANRAAKHVLTQAAVKP